MKRQPLIVLLLIVTAVAIPRPASAQIEIIEEAIKEVIMAADLVVQKAQTNTIILQEAQKELENLMEQTQLDDIVNWVQQQKDLFSEYYQELWQVKNALTAYQKLVGLLDKQLQLVQDCQRARLIVQQDRHFSAAELQNILKVYEGIFSQSVATINQLGVVINSFLVQMNDGDRLQLIHTAQAGIDKNYSDLRTYTQQNFLISSQRARDQQEIDGIRALYGITTN